MTSNEVRIVPQNGPDPKVLERAFAPTMQAFRRQREFDWRRQAVPNNLFQQDWLLDLMRHEFGADDYNRHQAERRAAAGASLEDDEPELPARHKALLHALARYRADMPQKQRPARDRDSALILHYRAARRRKSASMDRLNLSIGRRFWAMDGPTNHTGLI